ncbi:MAG: protein kinase [Polyangiales bacterium]
MPRTGALRVAILALAAIAAILLAGCGDRGRVMSHWWLETPSTPTPRDVVLPAFLDDRVATNDAHYTLRTTLLLDEASRAQPMTLTVPQLESIVSLRANDREVAEIAPSPLQVYRGPVTHRFRLPDDEIRRGRIELVLEVRHAWPASSWVAEAPTVSNTKDGDPLGRVVQTFNDALAAWSFGTVLLVALSYGLLFLLDRRWRSNRWFFVEASFGATYPAFAFGLTQVIFGRADLAIVGAASVIAAVASVYFVHDHFGLGAPHRVWRWLVGLSIALALTTRGDPFRAYAWELPVVALTVCLVVAYELHVFLRLWRRPQRPKNLAAITLAWPAGIALGGVDALPWIGLDLRTHGVRLAPAAIAVMATLRVVALTREHLRSLRRADGLNRELGARVDALEERNREVQRLNEELRRQVSERSADMSGVLARLSDGRGQGATLRAGDVVHDRYRIVRSLGEGGMGAVFEATRLSDGRHFALKVVTGVADSHALARLAREAQLASSINHPNVVSVVDIDVAREGFLFIVMDLVEGTPLRSSESRFGDPGWALPVLAQLADGLAAIHAHGIVHRDMKPSNILLTGGIDGPVVAKIVDFGVSTIAGLESSNRDVTPSLELTGGGLIGFGRSDAAESLATVAESPRPRTPRNSDPSAVTVAAPQVSPSTSPPSPLLAYTPLTRTGALVGTPAYMAPELANGSRATVASDVFSLGVIAYEMLSKKRPFITPPVLVRREGGTVYPATPLTQLASRVSSAVADVVMRAIDPSPDRRPSAEQLRAAFADETTVDDVRSA